MRRALLLAALLPLASGCARSAPPAAPAPAAAPGALRADSYAARMSEAVMRRNPRVFHRWDYVAGLALLAVDETGRATGDPRHAAYVRENMEHWVRPDGSIDGYRPEEFNIDHVNQGKLLFRLHARTGDPRYRQAAGRVRDQMRRHPRTREGGFWHKQIYPHQLWLDGAYMASPFLAEYAVVFGEPELLDDVARQLLLIARHTRDPATGLLHHGWDESRSMPWADPQTGRSRSFWGRAMGWYLMAVVDVLDHLPESHPDRPAVVRVLQDAADAVLRVQDPVTGLWYQVLDQPNREGNYHEASASSMFAYALAKGARKGYLPAGHRAAAERAYAGILRHFVRVDDDGLLSLHGINEVAGLGGPRGRDGTFEYYMSEPVVKNDYKGVGPFILASVELGR